MCAEAGGIIPCLISLPQLTPAPFRDREMTGDESGIICRLFAMASGSKVSLLAGWVMIPAFLIIQKNPQ